MSIESILSWGLGFCFVPTPTMDYLGYFIMFISFLGKLKGFLGGCALHAAHFNLRQP